MTLRGLKINYVWSIFLLSLFHACAPPEPIRLENHGPHPATGIPGHQRLLAVLDFENRTRVPETKIGEAVADKLISQLIRTRQFILVERPQIEKMLAEQAVGQSGLVTETTRAQVGQLLGVQGLVLGSVVELSESFESGKIGQKKEPWSFQLNASVARVAIQYRLVDAVTDRVIFSDEIFKQEIKPSFGLKTKDFDLNNLSELDETLVGKALQKAVDEMVLKISRRAGKLTWYGKILKVTDDWIYFTPGRDAGIQAGEIFEVQSRQRTEANSDNLTVGLIQVAGFLQDRVCRAKLLEGGNLDAGDWVLEFKGPIPAQADKF